ncbi:MAG: NADP-dependent oxidoreductase [Gammaproteobacteria bacterium]|nr:NADP-dependent oxidoreductase [Gammaproteobacteria bacterium]
MSGHHDFRNRQVLLKRVPEGVAGPDDFEVRPAPVPEPQAGQVLVEAHYLQVEAALRLIVRDSKDFLFRVKPGDLIRNTVAGVVQRSEHPDFKAGDAVLAPIGVQRLGVIDAGAVQRCDTGLAPLPRWLGGLGITGLTAYFAMFTECRPQPGQTVVINGAAGGVGSIAGQLAKLAGARVIGITGSAEKCRWLVDELGFDVAINHHDGDLYEQLVAAAPDRIDVIFDNVGGEILDASLRWIALHGMVLLCGSTSQYTQAEMKGPKEYIWLGTMRARMQGFVVFDYADQYDLARRRLAAWAKSGAIKFPETILDGDVDAFPAAFQQLYDGVHRGKLLLRLPPAQA